VYYGCQHLQSHPDNPAIDELLLDIERKAATGRIDIPVNLCFALARGYRQLFQRISEQYPIPNGYNSANQTAMV
jgi:hypothetical protein